ncbi:MAG: response regulator [Thermodesulfobacteriota bacterium]
MEKPSFDPKLTRQHFSTKIFKVYLRCMEIHYPHVDVHAVCEKAGLSYAYIMDENNWVSTIFDRRFTEESIRASGDPDLPYKSGQMSLTADGMGSALYYLLRYTLSTTRIYRTLSAQILHFTKILTMRILSVEKNVIRIQYHPVRLQELTAEERGALIANLDHIYRNAVGYLKSVPKIHDNPEAEIDHHTELSPEGIPELFMNVTYRDRNPMKRMAKPLAAVLLFSVFCAVVWRSGFQPLYLEPDIVKGLLVSGVFSGALLAVLLSLYLKHRRIPIETRSTIAKLDAQYRDLQKAKEKIEDMNIALQKADKLKDDFLSNTSHELRTPLNGIIGIAESLLDGAAGDLSAETRRNLQLIASSGKRLADLVNDILDFSKLKNRDILLKKGPVDIRQLADVVLTIATPLTTGKDLRLINEIPEDFPLLDGDENRLHQILLNLVGNAVKFSDRGDISVRAAVEGKSARISVADNGIGIPADQHENIFKSFEQADGSIAREYGGTGLGLSVTKSLVEIHGGRIWVESSPGRGAVFFFTIPLSERPLKTAPRDQTAKQPPGLNGLRREDGAAPELPAKTFREKRKPVNDRRMVAVGPPEGEMDARTGFYDRREKLLVNDLAGIQVLAVDDEPVNLQVIRNNLHLAGASVLTAVSGPEALETIRQAKPDIILLDIMMPKMNGYETARRIRSLFSKEELPILFLSAKNQVRDLVDGFVSGGNDYITKPLSKNELLARIRFHAGLTRSRIKLAETEKKYSTILASIEEGYFETGLSGNFTFWNDSFVRMTGYQPEELAGGNFGALMEERVRKNVFKAANRVFRTGEPTKGFEFELRQKTGTKLAVEISISLIRNAQGSPLGFRGIARDITDRREKEKAENDRKTAEAATRAKSEFLANMSHEIRTPMNAIIGFSSLALEADLPQKRREYLRKIRSSAGSLLSILNDILDVSKIEAGKLTMESVAFQLTDVLENVTDMFAAKVAEKHLELLIAVDPLAPTALIGDPLRLGQILINLMSNALKFTDSGDIRLEVVPLEQPPEEVTLRFSVTDTGIGINTDQKAKLFSAFTQADSSVTRRYGGTGLGLAISKRLVELMDGAIDFTSEPGAGSTFFFTARFRRQTAADQPPLLVPEDIRGLRALVVDDIPVSRDHLVHLLNEFGCRAVGVENAGKALELMRRSAGSTEPFGLVVTDWRQPPGLDGVALAQALGKDPSLAGTAVIVKTFFCRRSDMEQAAAAGIRAVVNKPIARQRFFEILLEALGKRTDEQPARDEAISAEDHRTGADIAGKHILLVEDNVLNQQIVADVLTRAGLRVEIAANGQEALGRLAEGVYDAVLMDVQMPVMDGFETTRLIRGQARFRDLPIIAMTARTVEEDAGRCLAAGMNGYIDKTIDATRLVNTLAGHIQRLHNTERPSLPPRTTDGQPGQWHGDPPGIDVAAVLKRVEGNRRTLLKLFQGFEREYAGGVRKIQAAYRSGDIEDCIRCVHTLKGLAGNISAPGLYAAAADLEKALQTGNRPETEICLAHCQKALDMVLDSIRQSAFMEDPAPALPESPPVRDSRRKAALLAELERLLAENNYKALDIIEELKQCAHDARYGDFLHTLDEQIGRFQFKEAQLTLARMSGSSDAGDTEGMRQ